MTTPANPDALRCWQCGAEPLEVLEVTRIGDPTPTFIPDRWPAADHTHEVTPPTPANPDDVWIVPKVPVDPYWINDRGRIWSMNTETDDMTPEQAREFAALYLAAADEAEKRAAR